MFGRKATKEALTGALWKAALLIGFGLAGAFILTLAHTTRHHPDGVGNISATARFMLAGFAVLILLAGTAAILNYVGVVRGKEKASEQVELDNS